METNAHHYFLLLALILLLSIVTVELCTPQGAAARKLLLQDEPDTDDGGQHKMGASGSTSHHAGSATGDNDTVPVGVHLSPPSAFTLIGGDNNGTIVKINVSYPEIRAPPGTPTAFNLSVKYPHGHPHPPPSPGSSPDPGRIVPDPWYHWP